MHAALDATPLTLSSGGLPRYVLELSRALALEFPRDTYTLLSDQRFRIGTDLPSNLHAGPGPESRAARRWWLFGLPNRLRTSGVQVFHGTNFEVPYLGRTPAVITIHDLSPWKNPAWHRSAERVRRRTPVLLKMGRAKRVITVSEAVRSEAIERFHLQPEMVRAIPLAAAEEFRRTEAKPVYPKPFFLFAGTIEPRKNVPSLIEAWLRTRHQTGADLVLAGRLRSDAPALPSHEGLSLAGEVSDAELAVLYSQAVAFVYPTFYEGFGLPVLEAMQCGCPVITSDDRAVREVAGGAALHASSTEQLAECMRQVAGDPSFAAQLRAAGLARAQAFSWRNTARQTHEVYLEAISAAGEATLP